MPRLAHSVPKYRKHRASGQAVVTLGSRDFYLGPFSSKASRLEYDRLIGEWLANHRQPATTSGPSGYTVIEVAAAYWAFAQQFYQRVGQPTSTLLRVRVTCKLLRRVYGRSQVGDFGPLALRAIH
jgi:hypothetical protein